MKCQSCKKQKASLAGKKSSLIEDMNIIMCDSCTQRGFEPRHIVVLAMVGNWNVERTKQFIADRRYYGEEIKASEIV